MKKLLYVLLREDIIKRLRQNKYGNKEINKVLEALELPYVGIPDFKFTPPTPPEHKNILFKR